MYKGTLSRLAIFVFITSIGCVGTADKKKKIQWVETETGKWLVHDINRPAPPVVMPGEANCGDKAGAAPSDAIVLFDGNDLSKWQSAKKPGKPAPWKLGDGFFEVVKGTGNIRTKQKFSSCQLHLEFATPQVVSGDSQKRGNSGVFLMGLYELQILDSYNNRTYPDGQCAALYGQAVPLVNACRKPGEWQSYDVIFHRPVFDGQKVIKKARFTVLHNGVLVHDNVELQGGTGWLSDHAVTDYVPHADKGPLELQEHGNPVRFRNIWIRELKN
ncbi:MAG: DUF1080 domain-containing protein [Sedimentisphaerales bacterium]|nr:DUF1080 domain-containing protein [Sedimentisphaerales bacterium]